jgi:Glycosyltransferase (GlcNAc)
MVMASIFVQIASYHDYELPRTIKDCIEKSSGNNTINIGVHHTFVNNDDIVLPEFENVKYYISKAPENIGMGKSRLLAHQFYNNEDYYFQVDSHSRFKENWDVLLINDVVYYQKNGFEKPLITCYPQAYRYVDFKVVTTQADVTKITFSETSPGNFISSKIPLQHASTNSYGNIFSRSLSGGSIFTLKDFISPNLKIAGHGEEIFLAAMAYTNGYDLLLPTNNVLFHLYYDYEDPIKCLRKMVWDDYSDEWNKISIESLTFIKNVLSGNLKGVLGTSRTLEDFEMYTGLNFKEGIIDKDYDLC